MATFNTTTVYINGVNTVINSGDIVIKDGNKYRFEWCTYQFERWADLSRDSRYQQQNFEGGMITAEQKVE